MRTQRRPIVFLASRRDHVTLIVDIPDSELVIYAIRQLGGQFEAQARMMRRDAGHFPVKSYGNTNRVIAASRLENAATRLRVIENRYRIAVA